MIERSLIRSLRGLQGRGAGARPLALELPQSSFPAADLARLTERDPHISVTAPGAGPAPAPTVGSWAVPEDTPPLPSPLHEAGFRPATRLSGGDLLAIDEEPGPLSRRPRHDAPVIVAPSMAMVTQYHAYLARYPHIAALLVDGAVTDLSPLVGLDHLAGLWIYGIDADLTPLRSLPRLSRLFVRWHPVVRDPGAAGALPQLRRLAIHGYVGPNSVDLDLAWLQGMPRLERLDVSEGSGRTLSLGVLAGLSHLDELRLKAFRIVDLGPLAQCSRLRRVVLEDCEIVSLRGLASPA